jgi:uncharacterized membrane protein YfhO
MQWRVFLIFAELQPFQILIVAKNVPKKAASASKPAPSSNPTFPEIPWLAWVNKHGSLLYLVTASAMLLLLFGDYLFGSLLYLFDDVASDTINANYPRLKLVSDYLREEGLPGWSFRRGIGQNIFPGSLSDPFKFPLYALGGEKLVYGIAWMECFKLLLGGWLFTRYLKMMALDGYVSLLGGLLFAFSGYALIGSGWNIFSTNLTHAAFLLLSFELYYQRKQWWLFPLAVGLLAAFSPFYSYVYLAFLAVYTLWRYFTSGRARSWTDFTQLSAALIALTLLGFALTLPLWLPILKEMMDSPRATVSSLSEGLRSFPMFGFENAVNASLVALRTFSNNLNITATNYKLNYLEAPMNYCGLLSLLLLPQVFVGLGKRERIAYGGLFGIFFITQIFPYFRYAFWLFSGDYHRNLSHLFGMVVQLLALIALFKLVKNKKINVLLLVFTLIGLLGILYYPWKLKASPELQFLVAGFLVLEAGLIFLSTRPGARHLALAALPVVLVVELVFTAWPVLHDRFAITKTKWETEYYQEPNTLAAIHWIQAQDSSFYRIKKPSGSGSKKYNSLNDASAMQYQGVTAYQSFNHPGLINLLVGTGVIDTNSTRRDTLEQDTRWAIGIGNDLFLQTITNCKYIVKDIPYYKEGPFGKAIIDSLTSFGEQRVLRLKLALPLGVAYEHYMTESEALKLQPRMHRQSAMMKAGIVRQEFVPMLTGLKALVSDSIPTPDQYMVEMITADVAALQTDTFRVSQFRQNHITGHIDLKKRKLLFLSIPLDEGWHIKVDGKPVEPIMVNYAFIGLLLEQGSHDVALVFKVPLLKAMGLTSLFSWVLYVVLVLLTILLKFKERNR